jgi:hypothetical protein
VSWGWARRSLLACRCGARKQDPLEALSGDGFYLRLRLLQPVRHPHVAVHRRRGGEVLLSWGWSPLGEMKSPPSRGGSSTVAIGGDWGAGDRCARCCPFVVPPVAANRSRPLSGRTTTAWPTLGACAFRSMLISHNPGPRLRTSCFARHRVAFSNRGKFGWCTIFAKRCWTAGISARAV